MVKNYSLKHALKKATMTYAKAASLKNSAWGHGFIADGSDSPNWDRLFDRVSIGALATRRDGKTASDAKRIIDEYINEP